MGDVAKQFGVKLPAIALALTLTLAVRPLGAFLFAAAGLTIMAAAGC